MSETVSSTALNVAEQWQRDFPIVTRPFERMGEALNLTGSEVIAQLEVLKGQGILGRVGAAVRPNTIGASTLAAMSVPAERLQEVAELVNAEPAVNHNYERSHAINLWFVVTAPDRETVLETLNRIASNTGLEVHDLPLERAYHIDLGFRLKGPRRTKSSTVRRTCKPYKIEAEDQRLVSALEPGLKLVPRPYQALASQLGWSEGQVLSSLKRLVDVGVISRFGCILRHRRLGYASNAMAVWDVVDDQVDAIAERLAAIDCVTLCYRRTRRPPEWSFNLFAMIHGQERERVEAQIRAAELECGLHNYPNAVLFGTRCFKQSGARYFSNARGAA